VTLGKGLKSHFQDRLLPDAVFQLSPAFLSGIRVSKKDGSIRGGFVLPLRDRPLSPSFDRPNVTDPAVLEEAVAQGMENLRLSSGSAALLVPEPSVRVFVLTVDSFPRSGKERDTFIRWRIGKQMPLIPDDARIDYAVTPGRGTRKIIVAMARQTVVREYESLFEKAGLKPVLVTIPSLALINLVGQAGPSNGILLNLEDETLTLLAVMDSGWALYRQKGVGGSGGAEAENTIRFLEDKERKRIERLWVRTAVAAERPQLMDRLKDRIDLPLEPVIYEAPAAWNEAQKALLAPLVGQIL